MAALYGSYKNKKLSFKLNQHSKAKIIAYVCLQVLHAAQIKCNLFEKLLYQKNMKRKKRNECFGAWLMKVYFGIIRVVFIDLICSSRRCCTTTGLAMRLFPSLKVIYFV